MRGKEKETSTTCRSYLVNPVDLETIGREKTGSLHTANGLRTYIDICVGTQDRTIGA